MYNTIISGTDDEIIPNKNAEAFGELVLYLNDISLSQFLRDVNNEDRKVLKNLREHYLPRGKPRMIDFYTELISLQKKPGRKYNGPCHTS